MTRLEISFTPVQQRAASHLLEAIPVGSVFALQGEGGSGKTLILGEIHRACGGALLGMREFIASLQAHSPAAIEEALVSVVERAMVEHELIIVDDLHLVVNIVESCGLPPCGIVQCRLDSRSGPGNFDAKESDVRGGRSAAAASPAAGLSVQD